MSRWQFLIADRKIYGHDKKRGTCADICAMAGADRVLRGSITASRYYSSLAWPPLSETMSTSKVKLQSTEHDVFWILGLKGMAGQRRNWRRITDCCPS